MADEPTTDISPEGIDDQHVEDLIGEPIEVGHGGLPVFWVVGVIFVIIWALCAWKPWHGY